MMEPAEGYFFLRRVAADNALRTLTVIATPLGTARYRSLVETGERSFFVKLQIFPLTLT